MTIYHDVAEMLGTCVDEIIVVPIDVQLLTSNFVLLRCTREDGSHLRLILATADTTSAYIQAEDVLDIRSEAMEAGADSFFTMAEEKLLQKGKPIPLMPQPDTVLVTAQFLMYRDGDPVREIASGRNVIVHICTPSRWGRRYGSMLAAHYPEAKSAFRGWKMELGGTGVLEVEEDKLWIAVLACIEDGTILQAPKLDVKALDTCLTELGRFATQNELDVHIPVVGLKETGYGWGVISPHVQSILCDTYRLRTFVYSWKKGLVRVRRRRVVVKAQV